MKEIRELKSWTERYYKCQKSIEDIEVIYEFQEAGEIDEAEADLNLSNTEKTLSELEFMNMLGAEEDRLGAIMEINLCLS